jgi:hypothetical protein
MPKKVMKACGAQGLAIILTASLLATLGLASVFVNGASAVGPQPGTIVTVAGSVGGGLLATDTVNYGLYNGSGLNVGADGTMYLCQGGTISRVDPSTGLETVIAGAAPTGYNNASGVPANSTYAYCNSVYGTFDDITSDPTKGNIAFSSYNIVRVIAQSTGTFFGQSMTAGDIYTVAGDGVTGYSGDGGPATAAALANGPLAFDQQGNLIIGAEAVSVTSGTTPNVIRVVAGSTGTFYGQSMTAGYIYTIAGGGSTTPSSSGTPATGTSLSSPVNITVDNQGNIYLSGFGGFCVGSGCPTSTGVGLIIAENTGTFYGESMTAGDVYALSLTLPTNHYIASPPTLDASGNFVFPVAIQTCTSTCTDSGEYIDVYAESSGTFYGQSMTAGNLYTIAGDGQVGYSGDGGPATGASFANQGYFGGYDQLVVSPTSGDVYVSDFFSPLSVQNAYESPTAIRVIAEATSPSYGQSLTVGDIYKIAGCSGPDCNGNGLPALSAVTGGPNGYISNVVVDASGNTIFADNANHYIRVVPSNAGTFFGQSMMAGDVYTIAGDAYFGQNTNPPQPLPADGTPGTEVALGYSQILAVDHSGNVLFGIQGAIEVLAASTGTFYGQSMTTGDVYTIAGTGPQGGPLEDGVPAINASIFANEVAVDQAGNVLITDRSGHVLVVAENTGSYYGDPMTAGDIYTIAGSGAQAYSGGAGGPARSIALPDPYNVAADSAGNVVITDDTESVIWVLAETSGNYYGQSMSPGDMYLVAGIPGSNGANTGDGVSALSGTPFYPNGLALDPEGDIVWADGTDRVRVLAEHTGIYYGQSMTAGYLYTIAGDGVTGYTGNGGPATQAELLYDYAVAVTPTGNIVIADNGFLQEVIAPTTASLSPTLVTSLTFGSTQHLTVIVSGSVGTAPSGTVAVQYLECPSSATPCPGGTVEGPSTENLVGQSSSTASATNAFVPPAAGTYCVAASYSGDTNYLPLSETADTSWCFTVSQATPTVTVTPRFQVGSTLYQVAVTGPSGVADPSGSVTVGDSASGQCSITLSSGAGSCAISETPSSTPYTVTASYSGDGNYTTQQTTKPVLVLPVPTVSVTPTANPATSGPVAYAVQVSGSGATPTGEAVVSDGVGGTCTAVLPNGIGGCSISELASAGPFSIVAQYQGDSNYSPAQATVTEVVDKATPNVEIAPTSDPANGGNVGLVVQVSAQGGTPTGQVTVTDSSGTNCSATLSSGIGVCTLNMGSAPGTYSITAAYGGDTNFAGAQQVLTDSLGSSSSPTGNASAGTGGVSSSGTGTGNVNILLYEANPVGPPSFNSAGVFFDVAVSQGSTFASQVVQDCNLNGGNELLWWNPSANGGAGVWQPVIGDPGPTYSAGPPACISATIDASSSPTLAQLSGTVFAVGSNNGAPQFSGADNVGLAASTPFSTTVMVAGSPTPSIRETGALPRAVFFHDNGNGTATISGNPGRKLTTYPFTVTASNSEGTVHETFFLVVGKAPAFKSKATIVLKEGRSKAVTIKTMGSPAPQLSELGSLPPGTTFTNSGSGKARISGAPTSNGTYSVVVMADNVIGTTLQKLTISVR